MGFSNLVAFFIMLTAVVTLHLHGITDIQTTAQAAEALRPLAGDFAFVLFTAGIVGTGLLAVPILAGSAAYGIAEAFNWPIGLGLELLQARGFYMIVIIATVLGVVLNFTPVDPIKALFWSAVINGVISVPIMIVMMIAVREDVMGEFVISWWLRIFGWLATVSMAVVVLVMFATWQN
jgi:Mn2+/Fe2+ NRAMP family transporter